MQPVVKIKTILVDVLFLYVAQTGIKTYIKNTCQEMDAYQGDEFKFVVWPNYNRVLRSGFFRGRTQKWKNWLFQIIYFFHKLVGLPILAFWYRADLVFSPDILSPVWCPAKKVSVIHDAFFWESPDHYHPLWRKIYLYFLNQSLRFHTKILTVSQHAKERISHILDHAYPIEVVYSGVDFQGKENPAEMPIPSMEPPFFLHVGVMEKRKNLVTLVLAFNLFLRETGLDFKLVLVGQRGPRASLDDYDQVLATIKKYSMEEQVLLPGYLSNEALRDLYQQAFAYVFPSLNEGFGLPVLEAFSHGLPVVVSRQGALMEIGGDAVLVCENNSSGGIASAMKKVATDKVLRTEMIQAGFARLGLFSRKKFFLSLQDYFNRVLNE